MSRPVLRAGPLWHRNNFDDKWRFWWPIRGERRIWCRTCWWLQVTWEGIPYLVEPRSGWYCRNDFRCDCMFFDVSGRLLRDGKTQVMLVLQSHRHRIYSLKPKYIVDEHIGLGTVKLTDEEDHAEEFAWHFELVTTSFLRDIARRCEAYMADTYNSTSRARCMG